MVDFIRGIFDIKKIKPKTARDYKLWQRDCLMSHIGFCLFNLLNIQTEPKMLSVKSYLSIME